MRNLKIQHYIILVFAYLCPQSSMAQQANFDFVENKGQWDSQVKYAGSFGAGTFFLQKNGFTVLLKNGEDLVRVSGFSHGIPNKGSADSMMVREHAYRVSFEDASNNIEIIPDKVQETYNNYILGNDPSKWTNHCRIFKAITYKNVYPGIDIRYYADNGSLKYDIVVNPGGKVENIKLKYAGIEKIKMILV